MNEEVVVEKKRNSPPRGAGGAKNARRFTAAEKLKAVRLYKEEGFSLNLVSQEMGVSKSSVENWLKAYRLGGEAGLQPGVPGPRPKRLPAPLRLPQVQLTTGVRHNLFLAVKEALNNIAKHSQATEVRILLTLVSDGFVVMVEDNGRGFAIAGDVANGHDDTSDEIRDGLANMRVRLEKIGGRFEIQSIPGKGTQIYFRVHVEASV